MLFCNSQDRRYPLVVCVVESFWNLIFEIYVEVRVGILQGVIGRLYVRFCKIMKTKGNLFVKTATLKKTSLESLCLSAGRLSPCYKLETLCLYLSPIVAPSRVGRRYLEQCHLRGIRLVRVKRMFFFHSRALYLHNRVPVPNDV